MYENYSDNTNFTLAVPAHYLQPRYLDRTVSNDTYLPASTISERSSKSHSSDLTSDISSVSIHIYDNHMPHNNSQNIGHRNARADMSQKTHDVEKHLFYLYPYLTKKAKLHKVRHKQKVISNLPKRNRPDGNKQRFDRIQFYPSPNGGERLWQFQRWPESTNNHSSQMMDAQYSLHHPCYLDILPNVTTDIQNRFPTIPHTHRLPRTSPTNPGTPMPPCRSPTNPGTPTLPRTSPTNPGIPTSPCRSPTNPGTPTAPCRAPWTPNTSHNVHCNKRTKTNSKIYEVIHDNSIQYKHKIIVFVLCAILIIGLAVGLPILLKGKY